MKKLKLGLLLLISVLMLALMLSLSSCKRENNPPDGGTSDSDSVTDTEPGIDPAKKEGKVVFLDEDGTLLPCERIADMLGTINYEIVCDVNKRVPRIYYKDGKQTGVLQYIV